MILQQLSPEEALEHRGIRPTAVRLMIFKEMRALDCAVSHADIEQRLETVDKSTVSRTLSLFVSHHLAHSFTGAGGLMMYALCPDTCHCHDSENPEPGDMHAHFVCTVCHKTYCLRNRPVPRAEVPDGFTVNSASYLLTGICPSCQPQKND